MSRERPRTRRRYLQATGMVGLGALTGCLGASRDPGPPVPMGSILPTTGALSAHGSGMQEAVNLAVEHANAAGEGPLNRGIDIVNRDSESRPSTAVEQYEALVEEEGVVGFVGAVSSAASIALAEQIGDDEVMQVSPASTASVLTEMGYGEEDWPKYFARTAPTDGQQGVVMGRILGRSEYVGADTAAFVHVEDAHGEGLAERASQAFDGETTATVGYAPEGGDYASTLEEAFADDPDGVGLIGYPDEARPLLERWAAGDYGGQWVLDAKFHSPEILSGLPDAVAGAYVASPDPEAGSGDAQGYQRFVEEMDDASTPFAPYAYDAMFLQALAMEKATTDSPGGPPKEASGRAIAEFVREVTRPGGQTVTVGEFQKAKQAFARDDPITYEGAIGPITFTSSLDVRSPFAILQVGSDGSTSTVERLPRSFFEGKLLGDVARRRSTTVGAPAPRSDGVDASPHAKD